MKHLLILLVLSISFTISAQRILDESVTYYNLIQPEQTLDSSIKGYNVVVNTPYTMTVEDVKAQSLVDFEAEKAEYQNVLAQSKVDYQEKLDNYDGDVAQAKENYDIEMKDFKELSLLERLALTDQGKKPALKTPAKPRYVEPREPVYREPVLSDYLIFDSNALADNITLNGFEKGSDVIFNIELQKMEFQENAGQTYYTQPSKLTVIAKGEMIGEQSFGGESKFLSSASSNRIDLNRYEKANVKKVLAEIQQYINTTYGYTPIANSIKIEFPKNKKREYDQLEKAKITAISSLRKMTKEASLERRDAALDGLDKAEEIWMSELEKIDYSDEKALHNNTIAKSIFYNLLTIQTQLGQKSKAEKTLAQFQDKVIDLDLSSSEETLFSNLEKQIYKL